MTQSRRTRREVLAAGGAAAAFTIVAPHVLGGPGKTAPSDKLNIAGIGVGGMGGNNLGAVAGQNIVALCDVDHNYAAHTFKRHPRAKTYKDYRVMLEKQKDIEAVIIATPDHTHAVVTLACIRAGKHVYTQKPLTHDVYEARALTEAAKASKVATQMGIQGHSHDSTRMIVEWIQQGAIGPVDRVDAWCSLSYYPWGHAGWSSRWGQRPKDTPPLPAGMDWDLWIGPRPMRPYHPAYHPAVWRCWWEYGSGMMGDRGAHTLDPVFWALDLGAPTTVEATSLGLNADTHPLSAIVTYRFPARGKLPPVKLTWYEGTRAPRPEGVPDGRTVGEQQGGAIFHGSKGILTCGVYGGSVRIYPESLMKDVGRPKQTLPRVRGGHEMDWVNAAKAGRTGGACFQYSGPLTEVCSLGNVAKRVDARIHWDAKACKVTNLDKANQFIRWPYRKGWAL